MVTPGASTQKPCDGVVGAARICRRPRSRSPGSLYHLMPIGGQARLAAAMAAGSAVSTMGIAWECQPPRGGPEEEPLVPEVARLTGEIRV